MARRDGEGHGGSSTIPCTCNLRLLNHFQYVVEPGCKKHQDVNEYLQQRLKEPLAQEFREAQDKMRGRWLYQRQQALERATAIVQAARDKAAAEGRQVTFADVRRMSGFPDPVEFAEKMAKVPGRTMRQACQDLKNEVNAEKADREPPPGFDGNDFSALAEAGRLGTKAAELPDDGEHAAEYAILAELAGWLQANAEVGRGEYRAKEQALRHPPARAADPFEGLEPEEGDL